MDQGCIKLQTPEDVFWIPLEAKAIFKNYAVFWDVRPCSLVEVYRCFRGKYCLNHQSRTVSRGSTKLILLSWRWRQYNLPKWRHTFARYHGVTPQKTALFILTTVRTSNHKNTFVFIDVHVEIQWWNCLTPLHLRDTDKFLNVLCDLCSNNVKWTRGHPRPFVCMQDVTFQTTYT
jgi:hypothetical protein